MAMGAKFRIVRWKERYFLPHMTAVSGGRVKPVVLVLHEAHSP
jgi:hypothetical protein